MLQTVEAEIYTDGTIRFLEPLTIAKPMRALVTLLESDRAPLAEEGNAKVVLEFLRANRLPPESRPTVEEIDAQIKENRESWD